MDIFFWSCLVLVAYPYAIYPMLLVAINRLTARAAHRGNASFEPMVSIVLPVHDEAARITTKIGNLLELDYPKDKLQILVIGDGCTDDTLERASRAGAGRITSRPLALRGGKAAALNAGLELAVGEIVVFTDAAILLEPQALRYLVAHFADPTVGCVSGEDYIEGAAAEGLYGRLELLLRREEARLHSIAGASGCFYGQRRSLCKPFQPGMAPDFLSVLVTVAGGGRGLAEPRARGSIGAASSQSAEFARKIRTFLRGITALFAHARLLNPLRHPAFSFILWSHKLMRWLAPLPLLGCLVAAWMLRHSPLYGLLLYAQMALYATALAGLAWPQLAARSSILRVTAFFVLVNAAAFNAFVLWLAGQRVEVWQPTRRPG